MKKQHSKATEELTSAHEEMIELAKMKEQYSVDNRDAQIAALQKKQKQMSKDLKNLENVQSKSAVEAVGQITDNLETQHKEIAEKLSQLAAVKKENWSSLRDSITRETQVLQNQIDRITANMDSDKDN